MDILEGILGVNVLELVCLFGILVIMAMLKDREDK